MQTPDAKYVIVRNFYEEGKESQIIKTGLTLAQAQEHCNRDDTHAPKDQNGIRAWFDGYREAK